MRAELLNPFILQNIDESVLIGEINLLAKNLELTQSLDRLEVLAKNILIYSEMLYIVGECMARKKLAYEELKANTKIVEAKYLYKTRKEYNLANKEKPPAMSYFEALAFEFVKDDVIKLAKLNAEVMRFKNAYESYEHKINALKKQLEIVKYQDNLGNNYGN